MGMEALQDTVVREILRYFWNSVKTTKRTILWGTKMTLPADLRKL